MSTQLVVVALTLVMAVGFVAEARYTDFWINRYLVQNNPEKQDLASNLETAKQYLSELQSKEHKLINTEVEKIKDLRTFISLEQIEQGAEKCNEKAVRILIENNKLVGDVGMKVRDRQVFLTKLETLIYNAFVKHALDCKDVYPIKYQEAKEAEGSLISLAEMATSAEELKLGSKHLGQGGHYGLVKAAQQAGDADVQYAFIKNDGLSSHGSFNKEKYHELFVKYMQTPCQYLLQKLEKNLFVPAIFDWHYAPANSNNPIRLVPMNTYVQCQAIMDDPERFFKKMVKYASDPQSALGGN